MDDNKKTKSSKKNPVEDKVLQLENEVLAYKEQFARALADYKNLEKRFDEEKQEFVKYANKELLIRLIPALDAMFLAGKYTEDEGVKLTVKTVLDSLREVGVAKIEAEGAEFNPEIMEAVATGDGDENVVIEEMRPGFTLNGKLLRAAQVKVGKQAN